MERFERKNSQSTTGKEWVIACPGTLTAIAEVTKENKGTNKSKYYSFNATIVVPGGEAKIVGQVYENLLPFLGGKPTVGQELQFVATEEDLNQGFNGRWGISGGIVDKVSDDFLDAMKALQD
jgi:hypothetical protein